MTDIRHPYWNLARQIAIGAVAGALVGAVYFYILIITCMKFAHEFDPRYRFLGLEILGAPVFGLIAAGPLGGLFGLCVWLKARGIPLKRTQPSLFRAASAAVAMVGGLFTGISGWLMEVVVRAYFTGRLGIGTPGTSIRIMGIDVFLVGFGVGFVMFGWCAWMFLRLPGESIIDTVPGTHSSDPDNPYSVGRQS